MTRDIEFVIDCDEQRVAGLVAEFATDSYVRVEAASAAVRNASVNRAVSCVWRQATIPIARSGSPVSVRIAAVTVRAATRAISPSRRRRYRQYARSRFGIVPSR